MIVNLNCFSCAKNSSAGAQFIKYLNHGKVTPGVLDHKKKRAFLLS